MKRSSWTTAATPRICHFERSNYLIISLPGKRTVIIPYLVFLSRQRFQFQSSISLFILNKSKIMFSEIRKPLACNCSIIGFIFFKIPICFALCITPSEPVNFKFNFKANFLAFKSSSTNYAITISPKGRSARPDIRWKRRSAG